ncbi:peptidoglycan-binding protein [Varibaculum vaginae]|uniref:peptidoglycan-binding protein n=1 Tax=Varibaculum vaginae TaxID=2364797 RepID=UPI00135B2E02|nr:peptidoglycan-binding protein [Varibaculum vaginae]
MSKVFNGCFRLAVFLLASALVVPLSAQTAYAHEGVGIVKAGINKQIVKAEDSSPAGDRAQESADADSNSEAQSENTQQNADDKGQKQGEEESKTMERSAGASRGPTIFVSHVLWYGEWSNEVRTMQLGLAHYYPECVNFTPDSGFGAKTQAAVKCVQRKLGVYPDGGFGFTTTLKMRHAGIPAAIVGKIDINFNLVRGQVNSVYVRNLQTWMMVNYPDECAIVWPDTTFGAGTARCVRNIRQKLGLSASEVADRSFADAVREDSAAEIFIKDAPEPSPNHWTSATMWSGSRVNSVRVLQQGLNKYFPQYAGFWTDGIFGGRTAAAVKAFQRDHGIYPDGGVGMLTAKALRAGGVPVWVIPSTRFISVMGYGSSGYKVEVVQTALAHLNPSYCTFTPDGSFGWGTQECVKKFQSENGIYPDGKVGYSTIRALKAKGMYFDYVGSGDAQLDATLESILARHGSLSSAYSYVVNNYHYIGASGKPYPTGSNWDIQYAKEFFANGGGNCYSFAAAYKWLARALGYPSARVRLGYVFNARWPHGWNEIDISGTTYIFDPDEDMAFKSSKGGWAFYYKTYWNAPIYYWDSSKRRLN